MASDITLMEVATVIARVNDSQNHVPSHSTCWMPLLLLSRYILESHTKALVSGPAQTIIPCICAAV